MYLDNNSLPNLFIVGAPKCGTTSLVTLLSTGDCFVPVTKEPHFLSHDIFQNIVKLEDYKKLYKKTKCAITIDASTHYLYSESALEYIANSQAKVIILLRSPNDILHALHWEKLNQGIEDNENLSEVINECCREKRTLRLNYVKMAKFSGFVKKYMSSIHEDRLLILTLDQLYKDFDQTIKKLEDFLNIEIKASSLQHANKASRNRLRFIKKISNKILEYKRSLGLNHWNTGILNFINKMNTVEKKYTYVKHDLDFTEEVRLLAKISSS